MRSLLLVALAIALVPANAWAAPSTAEKSTAQQISGHIKQSGQLRNYRIGVSYQNGIATLAGTVTGAEQRDAAIRLAKQVNGVQRVECQLECVAAADSEAASNNFSNQQSAVDHGKQRSTLSVRPQSKPTAKTADFQGDGSNVVPARREQQQQQIQPMRQMQSERGQIQAPPQPFRQQGPMQATAQQQQRRPMGMSPQGAPRRARPMRRGGNMPMPAARTAIDPAVRQASAQGCYQAGGPQAQGMGAMGGPGMMPGPGMGMPGPGMGPMPSGVVPASYGHGPSYENPSMPGYAWPSYASYPNYAALSYPQQYSPTAWPYIGPFYPYPQVPLAWRKVSLEWDDGWWFLDFSAHNSSH